MAGTRKSCDAPSEILLRNDHTPADHRKEAAHIFFHQPVQPPVPHVYEQDTPPHEVGEELPLSLLEFKRAFEAVSARSAPGPDGIPWAVLRNVDEEDGF